MAKKELLFVLGVVLLFSFNTNAGERLEFKKEDIEFAQSIADKSRQISMSAIKEEWLKLQEMQGGTSLDLLTSDKREPEHGLKIFVSSSMGKELLKNYIKQAKAYKATLVFNGLPEGSWRKLAELVYDITGGDEEAVSIQIDDLAFTEYGITSVPAIVLHNESSVFEQDGSDTAPVFDKVTGNIGIKRALELMVEKGELSTLAAQVLEEAKAK
jgi:type-F conjugative transfer system pilin assembly protein TrbC